MGNMCSSDIYEEIKKNHSQEFQKLLANNELLKNFESKVKDLQGKVEAGINQKKK
jgi:hypothetical protein